jgi:hypothetical protein
VETDLIDHLSSVHNDNDNDNDDQRLGLTGDGSPLLFSQWFPPFVDVFFAKVQFDVCKVFSTLLVQLPSSKLSQTVFKLTFSMFFNVFHFDMFIFFSVFSF